MPHLDTHTETNNLSTVLEKVNLKQWSRTGSAVLSMVQSKCMIIIISSQSSLLDPLDHPHWSLFSSSPTISWLQSQDHTPLLPVCRTSFVEQASSYSSCSLSVRSFIITQLFSIVTLILDPLLTHDPSRRVFHSRFKTFFLSTKSFCP